MDTTYPRHLATERLALETIDAEDEAHLAVCLTCRAERRLRLARGPAAHVRLGPYRVLGEIGRGGMGRVLAVRDGEGRPLAVKLMTKTSFKRRFDQEARLQPLVCHEHVLPVVAHLTEPLALVLPFVEGPSLARLLFEAASLLGRELELAEKLSLFRDLVAGVEAIHRAGLVHRDLKPQNVLIDAAGARPVVRVADFGLIKATHEPGLTRTGDVFGTPAYMAPEQSQDASRVSARADVWSLGVILLELLTSHRPPPSPSAMDKLPEDAWGQLARQLLREDPDERPAHAGEVWETLPATEPLDDALVAVCRWLAPVPRWSGDLRGDSATLPLVPNVLPAERDTFVDRDEVARLAALLAPPGEGLPSELSSPGPRPRLVTVLGAAGLGKTRLALAYARLFLEDWPGGIWFCDLSAARTPETITDTIAAVLQVPMDELLASKQACLLLLDGWQAPSSSAEHTVGRWMQRSDSVHFLITARHPLEFPGETTLALQPLDGPQGVTLFEHRARAVRDSFDPSLEDREAICALVARLGGSPEAIERAAARVNLMSPLDLLEEAEQSEER